MTEPVTQPAPESPPESPPEVVPEAATEPAGESASFRVADYLRSLILRGGIAPGDRVRQEEVAQQFGASRIPVREALRMLASEGLVEHAANKGAWVPRLGMHEVDVMYRMREQLEPLLIAESIPNLTSHELWRLEEVQQQIEALPSGEEEFGSDGVAAFLDLDRQFHMLTYGGCRIDQLTVVVERLWNSTQHYRRAFMHLTGPGRLWVVNAEHRLLLDAVERRDVEDAGRFLAGHIRRTRIELSHHPEVFGGLP